MSEPEQNPGAPLTSEHLREAAEWAIRARAAGKSVPIDGHERSYDQRYWSCGTSCCIHGAAHLLARGRETEFGPSEFDYRDLSTETRRNIINELWDGISPRAPERILAILGLEHGPGGNS